MGDKNANVLVRVGGDVKPLKKALKSGKGMLGEFTGQVRASINDVAKWGAAAGVAAAGVAVALVKSAAESARELQNLANVSGIGVERFQKLEFAAKKMNIESDKMADIFKDTRDKVGDFLQTGGGPLADFFDNIAPKVGVTADQFKDLSGPDALQLYVNSLEEANVSQNEMTFFMEAIASDATLLLPLMKDNGKALGEMTTRADELNIVLSEVEVEQLANATVGFDEMSASVKTVTDRIAIQLAPILGAISDRMSEAGGEAGGMQEAIDTAFQIAIRGAGFVANAIRGIQLVVKGLEISYLGLKSLVLTVTTIIAEQIDGLVSGFIGDINFLIESVNNIPGIDMATMIFNESVFTTKVRGLKDESVNEIRIAQQEMHDLLMKPLPGDALEDYLKGIQKAAKEAAEVSVAARDTALGVTSLSENPQVVAQQETLDAMTASYQDYAFGRVSAAEELSAAEKSIAAKSASNQEQIQTHINKAITGLMKSGSKDMFNIGKVAAVAVAARDGISAAIGSYKVGAGIGGPLMGAGFAAASLLATGVMIKDLAATSFSGGGGGTSAPPATAPNVTSGEQQGAGSPSRTLTVAEIDPNAFFSGSAVRGLAEQLLEFQRDGGQVVLA